MQGLIAAREVAEKMNRGQRFAQFRLMANCHFQRGCPRTLTKQQEQKRIKVQKLIHGHEYQ